MEVSSHTIRKASSPSAALGLYRLMHRRGTPPPNSYAALFALKAAAGDAALGPPPFFHHMHAHLLKLGLLPHVYVATALLHGYARRACMALARRLFEEMQHRNEVTWNTMITSCFAFGDAGEARRLFDAMPERDLATWSAMVSGCVGAGEVGMALGFFRKLMESEEFAPDEVTLVGVVAACNKGCYGFLGKSVHGYAQRRCWASNLVLGSALIDMYVKCGCLGSAREVFERMGERNVATWSGLINGMAVHGDGVEALALFERMRVAGVEPNELTFTGVLNACKHSGLVKEGMRNYSRMVEEYGLEPRIQHYGCMVDLLGRAGYLDEAYKLIETMVMEPNMTIWSSLLASCKMHRRFDVAERVIGRVLSLADPKRDGGVYALISDLYALNSKRDDAERVRKFMVEQNVRKVSGRSLIKTDNPASQMNASPC